MTYITAGVVNGAEFKAKLAQMTAEARTEVVKQAALDGAEEFYQTMRSNAPVLQKDDPRRTRGNLRDKISKMLLKSSEGIATVGVGIGKQDMRKKSGGAFYALWVEYGTKFMAAMPFMRPAFDSKKDQAARRTIGTFTAWLGGFSE